MTTRENVAERAGARGDSPLTRPMHMCQYMVNNEGVSAVARGPWGGPARERLWYLIFRCAHVLRFEQSPFSNSALTFGKTFVPIAIRAGARERGTVPVRTFGYRRIAYVGCCDIIQISIPRTSDLGCGFARKPHRIRRITVARCSYSI